MKKKYFLPFAIIVCITSFFILCNQKEVNKGDLTVNLDELETSNSLEEYFEKNKIYLISNEKNTIYNGPSQKGFTLNFQDENKQNYIIYYNGKILDGYGNDTRGDRLFKLEYYFHNDENNVPLAYERIRNEDYMNPEQENLISIIKNYIVMWGDVEEGKEWTQSVTVEGKKYIAKTKISDVNEKIYKLSTIIENIENYKNNIYKEERIYEKKQGLISISCTASGMGNDEFIELYKKDKK